MEARDPARSVTRSRNQAIVVTFHRAGPGADPTLAVTRAKLSSNCHFSGAGDILSEIVSPFWSFAIRSRAATIGLELRARAPVVS